MTPARRGGSASRGGSVRPGAPTGGSDPKTWPVKIATSYGGVVVREGSDGLEVALIRPQSANHDTAKKQVWALPKGAKEEGETPEDAAVREVREETGLGAEVIGHIDGITYWFAWAPEQVRYKKTVHFFLMRHTSGEPTPDAVEVAEVRFVPLATAHTDASYASEKKVLKTAAELARGAFARDDPRTPGLAGPQS
jgi:ADP-ribose pyrophosphatase YjhB (NUDIX family)